MSRQNATSKISKNLFFALLCILCSLKLLRAKWGEGLCRDGRKQSPIDIWKEFCWVSKIPRIEFKELTPSNITIIKYEYNAKMKFPKSKGTISGGDLKEDFLFEYISLSSRSEHRIGGEEFPLEVQFFFTGKSSNVAIASLFIIGESDKFSSLNEVKAENNSIKIQNFDPMLLLPSKLDWFYKYDGSFTEPLCTENVTWFVFIETSDITKEHFDFLNQYISPNSSRGVHHINGRTVYYSKSVSVHYHKNTLLVYLFLYVLCHNIYL